MRLAQLLIKHKQQRLHFRIQCFLNGNSASDDSNLIIPVAALNFLPEDVPVNHLSHASYKIELLAGLLPPLPLNIKYLYASQYLEYDVYCQCRNFLHKYL